MERIVYNSEDYNYRIIPDILEIFGIRWLRCGQKLSTTKKRISIQLSDGSCIGQFKGTCWVESPTDLITVVNLTLSDIYHPVFAIVPMTWFGGDFDKVSKTWFGGDYERDYVIVNTQKRISFHSAWNTWIEDMWRVMED